MPDLEILEHLGPEPVPQEEIDAVNELQTGDYEVWSEKLVAITEEAYEIFIRLGISSMLHSGDVVVAIYTPEGDQVTAICGTYLHAVAGQIPIKFIMKHFLNDKTVGVREGDIFYCNEALYGGIHNCDQMAVEPIFYNGELIAWSAAATHQPETGATEPGGLPVTAKSRHDEGMKLTPIKLAEDYVLKADLMEMMVNMISRAPRMQAIDVRARCTAADRVRKRVQDIASQKGVRFLKAIFRKMIMATAEGVRNKLSRWEDGTYRGVVFSDSVGLEPALARMVMSITKKGDRMIIDMTGTSPENEGSYNSFRHSTIAHICNTLYEFMFSDLPVSSGLFEPIEFIIPLGTSANATPEAAISNSPPYAVQCFTLIQTLLSKAAYAAGDMFGVAAPMGNSGSGGVNAGINQHGVPFADICAFPLNTEGGGARPDRDGVNSWGFPWCPWGKAPDVEEIETEQPQYHLFQKHWKDSGGYGKFRGGAGITLAWVVGPDVPYEAWMSWCRTSKRPLTMTINGSYTTRVHPGLQIVGANIMEKMKRGDKDIPSDIWQMVKERTIEGDYQFSHMARAIRPINSGDIFVSNAKAGTGWGDPIERAPDAVIQDIKDEIISHWTAQNIYHLVFDPEALRINYEETEKARKKELEDRKKRGMKYEDFEAVWSTKKPKDKDLHYYGAWPNAEPNRQIIRM